VSQLVPYSKRTPDPLDLDSAPGASKAGTEFVGVREYLAMIRRHWWVVIVVAAIAVAYTANTAMKERPRYRASSTVRLVDARRAVAGDMAGRPGMEGSFGYQSDPIESQIQVLMSGAVAAVAVDLKGLRLVPAAGNGWVEEIKDVHVSDSANTSSLLLHFANDGYTMVSGQKRLPATYGLPAEVDGVRLTVEKKPYADSVRLNVLPRDAAISYVSGGFQASSRPRTDILDLTYTGAERFEAKRIANAMAEAFKIHNASSSKDLSGRRRQFLENQLRQTDSMLSAAQATYSSFRSRRQVFSSTQAAGAEQSNLINIDTRRAELDAEKTTYENLLNQARAAEGNRYGALRTIASTPGIGTNPVVQQSYAQLEAYQRTRDSLMNTGAAPTNPDVVALNSLIQPAADKMIDAVEAHVLSLQAQLQALDRMRAAGATRISSAPAAESQELELQAQVQTIQQMSRQLQDELQRARMSEAVEGGQVEIVQLATSPGYQINTAKKKKLTTGGIVGLLLGCVVAILIDGLNASVRKRSDIERLLGIPSLAVIPRLPHVNGSGNGMHRLLPRMGSDRKSNNGSHEGELVTVFNARSPAAESFRTLRTNLMFSQASQALRMLVVTSASPGEGKTTTASNLAVSFAQQGMRVLLVDCDLRRSRLHRMFRLKREPGFSDLVLGYAEEDEVTHPTSVTGLYVICSGKLPPNPAEMLGSEESRRHFARLIEGYDLIVVDTPPLLAASDGAILSTIASGVVLVLRAGATENAAAQQSLQQLNSVGARIVGAVLNDPDAQVPKYGAYYKYDYSTADT
jgi:capsular exopolysaccharide synthesis family protein